jgi:CRISPR-associated endonuclease Cas1 subtype II
LTGCLLEALVEKKIRVIFCDAKRNPNAELVPYYNAYDCSRKIKAQIAWSDDLKGAVGADIVSEKIRKQADHLRDLKKESEESLLRSYLFQVEPHDASNREGHAAKVYFNALFGWTLREAKRIRSMPRSTTDTVLFYQPLIGRS